MTWHNNNSFNNYKSYDTNRPKPTRFPNDTKKTTINPTNYARQFTDDNGQHFKIQLTNKTDKKLDKNPTKMTWQTDKNTDQNYIRLNDWKTSNQLTIWPLTSSVASFFPLIWNKGRPEIITFVVCILMHKNIEENIECGLLFPYLR